MYEVLPGQTIEITFGRYNRCRATVVSVLEIHTGLVRVVLFDGVTALYDRTEYKVIPS